MNTKNTITPAHTQMWADFTTLFFCRTDRIGRRLPDALNYEGLAYTGPWRHYKESHKTYWYQALTSNMIAQHISGQLCDGMDTAMLQTYMVDPKGTSVASVIDLDVVAEGIHADVPEHFATQAEALVAARKVIGAAEGLCLRAHLEITKSAGYRIWIFHERSAWEQCRDLGHILLKRAGLHPKIEVFPVSALAGKDAVGSAVFVPFWGINAKRGKQVMIDPVTELPRDIFEFVADAILHRTSTERLAEIVEAAAASGEIKATPAKRERSERTAYEGDENPFVDDVAAAKGWQMQVNHCSSLNDLVMRCTNSLQISRAEWMHLASHLKIYGDWGVAEFHRLSAFDDRYDPTQTDRMIDSLNFGPVTCSKMECGLDPQDDCGMPEGKVSASYFAYKALKQLPMAGAAASRVKHIHRSAAGAQKTENKEGDNVNETVDTQELSEAETQAKAREKADGLITSASRAPLKQGWGPEDCLPQISSPFSVLGTRITHTKENAKKELVVTCVLGQKVQIVSRSRDIEDGSEYITLRWSEGFAWRDATVTRRTVSDARSILALADRGLMVTSENARLLVSYLAHLLDYQQDNIPIEWVTQSCGHKIVEGQAVFLIGDYQIADHECPVVRISPDADSENFLRALGPGEDYSDEQRIAKTRRWTEMATKLGAHPVAAFTTGAGFLAPLLGDLKVAQNLIVDLAGRSSSGKTTQSRFIASLWGLPPEVAGGLIRNWNSTPVFIERLAALCNDLPIFLDESHNAKPEVVQNIIYQYANGTGRGRGNRDGGVQRVSRYRGVMFSTGESRLADCSNHDGAQARILGFWGSPYGSAKQAKLVEEITEVSDECYGIVGPAFMSVYLAGRATYRNDLRQWHAEAVKRLGSSSDDGVGGRIVTICAAVEAAMRLACQITDINWDVTKIVDSAFRLLKGNRKTDSAQTSLELVGSWAAGHRGMFWSDEREKLEASQPFDSAEPREVYGKIRTTLDDSEMWCILPETLKRVLEQHDMNYHTCMSHWKDRGWIDTDSEKRLTRKVKLKGTATNMVQLSAEGMAVAFGDGLTLEEMDDKTRKEENEREAQAARERSDRDRERARSHSNPKQYLDAI